MCCALDGGLRRNCAGACMNGIRYDLNDTHYTVVCKGDNSYLPFRMIGVSYALVQYLIPGIILICINTAIAITVWTRPSRATVDVQRGQQKSEQAIFW